MSFTITPPPPNKIKTIVVLYAQHVLNEIWFKISFLRANPITKENELFKINFGIKFRLIWV